METPLFQANFKKINAARLFETARQSFGVGTNGISKNSLKNFPNHPLGE
jgi:hypothetical protein